MNQQKIMKNDDGYFILPTDRINLMNREELQDKILAILINDFEFEQPGLNDNLRDDHGFDSIDAIELLGKIELILGFTLSRQEKEKAMEIRTINDILDYIENISASRSVLSPFHEPTRRHHRLFGHYSHRLCRTGYYRQPQARAAPGSSPCAMTVC